MDQRVEAPMTAEVLEGGLPRQATPQAAVATTLRPRSRPTSHSTDDHFDGIGESPDAHCGGKPASLL